MTKNEESVIQTEVQEWWNAYYSSTRGSYIPSVDSVWDRVFHWRQLYSMIRSLAAHNAISDARDKLYRADEIVDGWRSK